MVIGANIMTELVGLMSPLGELTMESGGSPFKSITSVGVTNILTGGMVGPSSFIGCAASANSCTFYEHGSQTTLLSITSFGGSSFVVTLRKSHCGAAYIDGLFLVGGTLVKEGAALQFLGRQAKPCNSCLLHEFDPNRPFHNFTASTSGDRRILFSSVRATDCRIVKGSVRKWTSNSMS